MRPYALLWNASVAAVGFYTYVEYCPTWWWGGLYFLAFLTVYVPLSLDD